MSVIYTIRKSDSKLVVNCVRADRLLTILMYLQAEEKITAAELAHRLEVSERTIYRDMDALNMTGVPIYADSGSGGGFSLPSNYQVQLNGLTTSEIHALFLNMSNQVFQQLGIDQSLQSALLKLLNSLPSPNKDDVAWIQNRVYLDTDKWSPFKENIQFLQAAQQSIWQEKQVMMTYLSTTGEQLKRKIHPYGLVAKAGIWSVVCGEEDQITVYRLSKIQSFDILNDKFIRPQEFELAAFWKSWVQQYELNRTSYLVVLEVSQNYIPHLSQVIGETIMQQVQQQKSLAHPGWLTVTLSFKNKEEALRYVLPLGTHVMVTEPIELRESIKKYAIDIARLYGD
jgi:predicted DNA-binding transcriptional regulator YafY